MVADFNLLRMAVAGLVGTLAMVLTTAVFHALRIPMVDFGRLLATKLLRYHAHGTRLGIILHLVNGVILALIYAIFIVDRLPGPYWARGLTYGLALWLLLMVVILPLFGDGFFGSRGSRGVAGAALVVHLVYGLILGIAVAM